MGSLSDVLVNPPEKKKKNHALPPHVCYGLLKLFLEQDSWYGQSQGGGGTSSVDVDDHSCASQCQPLIQFVFIRGFVLLWL